jgi:hypothetical protein
VQQVAHPEEFLELLQGVVNGELAGGEVGLEFGE